MPEDCKDKMKTETDYDGEWKELPTLPSRKKVPLNKAIDVQAVSNGQVFGATFIWKWYEKFGEQTTAEVLEIYSLFY